MQSKPHSPKLSALIFGNHIGMNRPALKVRTYVVVVVVLVHVAVNDDRWYQKSFCLYLYPHEQNDKQVDIVVVVVLVVVIDDKCHLSSCPHYSIESVALKVAAESYVKNME